jgi:hypothetical protein
MRKSFLSSWLHRFVLGLESDDQQFGAVRVGLGAMYHVGIHVQGLAGLDDAIGLLVDLQFDRTIEHIANFVAVRMNVPGPASARLEAHLLHHHLFERAADRRLVHHGLRTDRRLLRHDHRLEAKPGAESQCQRGAEQERPFPDVLPKRFFSRVRHDCRHTE